MTLNIKIAGYRAVQLMFHGFVKILKRDPQIVVNKPGAVREIPAALREDGIRKVMIVTDPGLVKLGIIDPVILSMKEAGIEVALYGTCSPDPTFDDVKDCLAFLRAHEVEGIIAVGGGSSMDTAKMAMAVNSLPELDDLSVLAGNNAIGRRKIKPFLPFYTVPTTAGTGSEATTVAAVSDPVTHRKYTVQDNVLQCSRIFLDANLMLSVPASVTAATGMDALTHAVESYIGVFYGSKATDEAGRKAVYLIMKYLRAACEDGSNLEARRGMATGSYLAGNAFSIAAVGYAHSFAHASAALHSIPHGAICGIMLPGLLEYYGAKAEKRLAKLARTTKVTTPDRSQAEQAQDFIDSIRQLREDIGLPSKLPAMTESEMETICKNSLKEANPIYPVPRIMLMDDARSFLRSVTEGGE